MKLLIATISLGALASLCSFTRVNIALTPQHSQSVRNFHTDNDTTLAALMAGNKRFVENKLIHPDQDSAFVHKLSTSQHPKAIVLTCSDSRLSPEIIFDQGLGDLFVIRNAGNVVDDNVLGSMEYAIEHLGVRTVIVLGHESCGAVTATVNHLKTNNHIRKIEKEIRPALLAATKLPGDTVHNTVVQNTLLSVKNIESDKTLVTEKIHLADLSIYAAVYDLKTGKVNIVKQ